MNMRCLVWTYLTTALITLVSNIACKSLTEADTRQPHVREQDPSQPSALSAAELLYSTEHQSLGELELLKIKIRSRAPRNLFSSMSQLNKTLEEKRRILKEYREKLQELNQLDDHMDYHHETIHKRDIHSFPAQGNHNSGHFKFPVKIAQPANHRQETRVQSAILVLHREQYLLRKYNLTSDSYNHSTNNQQRNVGYNVVLLVYQTLPGYMRRLVTSKVISLIRTDKIQIDVTEIVQSWIDEPGMNHGIEIECLSHNISHILSHSNSQLTSLDIVTYERTINVKRKRRDTSDSEACRPGSCCRRPVQIPLTEVNLHIEEIHLPGEYIEAYLCSGRCPRNHKLHNYWSHIKNTLRGSRYPSMRNKCAPSAFESYTYTHWDEEGYLTWTSYDDIIVKECACV